MNAPERVGPGPMTDGGRAAQPAPKGAVVRTSRERAERSAIRNLLNCYLREVAGPGDHLRQGVPAALAATLPLGWRHGRRTDTALLVELPTSRAQLVVATERRGGMRNYRFSYPVLGRVHGGRWEALGWQALARALIDELSAASACPFNDELLAQIRNSIDNTAAMLAHRALHPAPATAGDPYLLSEQALAYGHAFHPAPKCRDWGRDVDETAFAPEFGRRMQLHWFRAPRACLQIRTVAPLTPQHLLDALAPDGVAAGDEHGLIPAHPLQAEYLRGLPAVREALARGIVEDLGPQGGEYFATASVRTLYRPGSPWFVKGSLNIRITNCVRKNAVYELESALALHALLQPLQADVSRVFGGLRLLGEPGYLTLDLPGLDTAERVQVQEGFGVIVRESIERVLQAGECAVMAAGLFQEGAPLAARVPVAAPEAWLRHYVRALVPPMLHYFFEHGVIFEPHLQNTVICLRDGLPAAVAVRDFEGVKLVAERWPADRLPQLGERALRSVQYGAEQGWNRVRYCLFVNNLCEAVSYLARHRPELEPRLWAVVRGEVEGYLRHAAPASARAPLSRLLGGEPLPNKANLLLRFGRQPDRAATYTPLPNPLGVREA